MERLSTAQIQAGKRTRMAPVAYLTHKDEPIDMYEAYIDDGVKPLKHGINPRNIFDDVDRVDRKYLRAVKEFIRLKGLPSRSHKNI